MVQNYKKPNISDNLAQKALKFCGNNKDFRNLSQMADFALRILIERLEKRGN